MHLLIPFELITMHLLIQTVLLRMEKTLLIQFPFLMPLAKVVEASLIYTKKEDLILRQEKLTLELPSKILLQLRKQLTKEQNNN